MDKATGDCLKDQAATTVGSITGYTPHFASVDEVHRTATFLLAFGAADAKLFEVLTAYDRAEYPKALRLLEESLSLLDAAKPKEKPGENWLPFETTPPGPGPCGLPEPWEGAIRARCDRDSRNGTIAEDHKCRRAPGRRIERTLFAKMRLVSADVTATFSIVDGLAISNRAHLSDGVAANAHPLNALANRSPVQTIEVEIQKTGAASLLAGVRDVVLWLEYEHLT
jgi:hypothetical protein